MKEFLLVFRSDFSAMPQRTQEQAEAATKRWMDWVNNLAAQNKLADKGNRLHNSGKVVKADMVVNGPYTRSKNLLAAIRL